MKTKYNLFILIGSIFFSSCELSKEDFSAASFVDVKEMIELVNDLRKEGCQCGDTYMESVGKLKWDQELERAAKVHSIDMFSENYFSHTSLNGDNFADRVNGTNYEGTPKGENIAHGYLSEQAVFKGWKNSPGHCRNMMNPGHTDFAVGRSGSYWTMVLGAK